MEKVRQAKKSELVKGSYVLVDYKGGGIEAGLLNYNPKIYGIQEITSIDEKGHYWLSCGSGMTLKGLMIPTSEMIEDYEIFMQFCAVEEKKNPSDYKTADEQVDYVTKIRKAASKKFLKLKSYPNIEKECNKILEIMKENQDFLCKKANRPLLAYIMLRWQNLYYAGRIVYGEEKYGYQCQNNPKYEFEGMENNETNERFIYDAWGAGIEMEKMLPAEFLKKHKRSRSSSMEQFNEADFDELSSYYNQNDEFTKLLYKKNKTMNDWYSLLGNKNHRYHSLYQTKHSIDNHLLCVIGNGYSWNKDGFISNNGPSGEDEVDFGKFPMLKGNSKGEGLKIEQKVNKILTQSFVQDCLNNAKKKHLETIAQNTKKDLSSSLDLGHHMIDLVFGKKSKSKTFFKPHKIIVELENKTFNTFKKKKEIQKLSKRFNELRTNLLKRMPKNLNTVEQGKWQSKNSTPEYKELTTKLSQFYSQLTKLVKEKFSTLKLSGEQIRDIEVFNKKAMSDFLNSAEYKKMFGDRKKTKQVDSESGNYYPLSRYSAMLKMPKNVHSSYVKAAINICLNIVKYSKVEAEQSEDNKERTLDNIAIAKKFLSENGYSEYKKDLPKTVNKYSILKQIQIQFKPILKLYPAAKKTNVYEQELNSSNLYLNDTKKNEYADDNIYCNIKIPSSDVVNGISNNVEFLTGTKIYTPIKQFLENLKNIKDIKAIFFYVDNIKNNNKESCQITIEIKITGKQYHFDDNLKCEKEFVEQGFLLGHHTMALELEDYFLTTQKSITLGSTHPHNIDGKQYFSNSQSFDVYDKNWILLDSYRIDERKCNLFYGGSKSELTTWLTEQHATMKGSDKDYGTYDSTKTNNNGKDGKKCLYSHDFMLWLKEHQPVSQKNG